MLGASAVKQYYPKLHEEIQQKYQFIVEFDKQGNDEFKCYDVGTPKFSRYISQVTGFREIPAQGRRSDISMIATELCGVNLSTGYYKEHHLGEYLVVEEWLRILQIALDWLQDSDLPRFKQ